MCSGNGGMIVLVKDDRVGDCEFEEKLNCCSKRMQFPLYGSCLLYTW